MTQYTGLYEIQPTGTARRLATQQVGYDHTKKINCGSANCSLLTEYHSLLALDEFNVIFRTTTDEFNVIPRSMQNTPPESADATQHFIILYNCFLLTYNRLYNIK